MYEDILLQVHKPARYIGAEWNVSKKEFDKARVRFALSYPDLYEVGMSNLGIRIIYGLLNTIEGVVCERVFSPDLDMENKLRENNLELLSLESKRKLSEFDILGFSLASELTYSNVLNILDLAKMPFEASKRDNSLPLVVGGGPCSLNPEPMHEFFDLFVVGEAEEAISEIIHIYQKHKEDYKSSKMSKEELLFAFSGIEGVYVPRLYEVEYNEKGAVEKFSPRIPGVPLKIKKRVIKDLNSSFFPSDWLVPYIQIIHDRITLEIMRGCPNKCRFCQGRTQYYPFRIKSADNILGQASQTFAKTGYEEISLCGLSVSDYPKIDELLSRLFGLFKEEAVSVSLPSLKAKEIVAALATLIAKLKKTGLTFAPEAGTEELRQRMQKDFNEKDFFNSIEQAYSSGYQHVKLYFMIGLPFEEEKDLDGIAEMARNVSQLRKKTGNSPAQVNISINTLIPKPHTPFQWVKMENMETVKYKQDYLRKKMNNRKLKINFHNLQMSFLEGVLSRGDRRLSKVILSAFKKGARLDAWGNNFSPEKWLEAFSDCQVDPEFYIKEKPVRETLPWDFIDVGINRDVLASEFENSLI